MEKSCYKDFIIQKELGRGSFGVVYLVHQSVTKQPYVLKRINIGHIHHKYQQAALREVEILKKINHPHIIKYYYSFIEDNTLSIITEYAESGDLYQHLQKHRNKKQNFSEAELWRIMSELTEALKYLHQNNIIHRDIKCQNVFLSKNLTVKLGDLGASKLMTAEMQATRVGTPLYLSPEMIKQQPYDFKIDIWGLGCILYTLAAKESPFVGSNLITLGISIINRNPKSIPSIFSSRLNSIILSMLEKDPENRPNTQAILDIVKNKESPRGKQSYRVLNYESEVEEKKFIRLARPKPINPVMLETMPTKPYFKDRASLLRMSSSELCSLKSTFIEVNRKSYRNMTKESSLNELLKDTERMNRAYEPRAETAFSVSNFQGLKRPTTAKPSLRTIIKSNTTVKINNFVPPNKVNKLKITVSDLIHYNTTKNNVN